MPWLSGVILACSAAISVLKHDFDDFACTPEGSWALFEMVLGMYIITKYEQFREASVVLICIFFFLVPRQAPGVQGG